MLKGYQVCNGLGCLKALVTSCARTLIHDVQRPIYKQQIIFSFFIPFLSLFYHFIYIDIILNDNISMTEVS